MAALPLGALPVMLFAEVALYSLSGAADVGLLVSAEAAFDAIIVQTEMELVAWSRELAGSGLALATEGSLPSTSRHSSWPARALRCRRGTR
jgi:hypothetical protein